jgi:hypothetical protein
MNERICAHCAYAIQAARARDRPAVELHGEFASLNFAEGAHVQARSVTGAPPLPLPA